MFADNAISLCDTVELLEPVDDAPKGARGGVLEFMEDGAVMVEVMTVPELDAVERIVFAAPTSLRLVKRAFA